MDKPEYKCSMASRFRGFLPVVVDVETGGFDARTDALLEIAAIPLSMDGDSQIHPAETVSVHVEPFPGARLDPKALAFNGIDPNHPFRMAVAEAEALRQICNPIRKAVKANGCKRAILVGHNAPFDLGFLNAAVERCSFKRNPFHPFSTLDTVSLSALAFGQTVLARAVQCAELEWDSDCAHSAIYDTERTAALFCTIVNSWQNLSPFQPCGSPP